MNLFVIVKSKTFPTKYFHQSNISKKLVKRAQKEISSNRCNSTRRIDGEANATANWKSLWFDDRKKGRIESVWYGKETELVLLRWHGGRLCGFQTNRKRRKSLGWFEGIEGRKRGGKGGRNKSSASNRGRVLARFYSQTLNSIAIGFLASFLPKREIFLFYSLILSSTISFLFREVCFHFFFSVIHAH